MSASIDSDMISLMCSGELPWPSLPIDSLAGQAIFLSSIMTGPGLMRSRHCSTMRSDCSISWMLMRKRP